MNNPQDRKTRCLVLACGNTLRGDDGVGPWLAAWAEERFGEMTGVRVISRQQWTPELADDIAHAEGLVFVDCAIDTEPGAVRVKRIDAIGDAGGLATHHVDAGRLLRLAEELYGTRPATSLLLTIGAGSVEMGEGFSEAVEKALAEACALLKDAVEKILRG